VCDLVPKGPEKGKRVVPPCRRSGWYQQREHWRYFSFLAGADSWGFACGGSHRLRNDVSHLDSDRRVGPSGCFAAEALLESGADVTIDVIERLPVPFGLVRFGVAPDHPHAKEVTEKRSPTPSSKSYRRAPSGSLEIFSDFLRRPIRHDASEDRPNDCNRYRVQGGCWLCRILRRGST
jgi:hypothetical protein